MKIPLKPLTIIYTRRESQIRNNLKIKYLKVDFFFQFFRTADLLVFNPTCPLHVKEGVYVEKVFPVAMEVQHQYKKKGVEMWLFSFFGKAEKQLKVTENGFLLGWQVSQSLRQTFTCFSSTCSAAVSRVVWHVTPTVSASSLRKSEDRSLLIGWGRTPMISPLTDWLPVDTWRPVPMPKHKFTFIWKKGRGKVHGGQILLHFNGAMSRSDYRAGFSHKWTV